jgi:hypothetical protein
MIERVASTALRIKQSIRDQRRQVMGEEEAYLFNVIVIKSPRSGPQYIASCSPPHSKSFSSATIDMKDTERTTCELYEGKTRARQNEHGYYIRAKMRPGVHSLKWATHAIGMQTRKTFSPT